jgi:Mitochondrial carrier protein
MIAFVPTELIKIRIQDCHAVTHQNIYSHLVRDIYAREGLRGFYRGFWPQFWRDVPTYGIYFLSYDVY